MRLLRIGIENFKSFQEWTEIDFTTGKVEAGRPVFLIGGMNGAGKTSLLEALNIALYGAPRDRVFKAMNRPLVAQGRLNSVFEVELEEDSGRGLTVRRTSWSQILGSRPASRGFAGAPDG